MSFLLNLIPPQYRLAVEGAILLALVSISFGAGYKVESWHWGASETAQVEETAKEVKAENDQGAKASGDLAKQEEKVRVEIKTVTKLVDRIVDRPVYRNICLDDDGLRAVNAALTGAPLPAGQPDGTVPGPGAPGQQGSGASAPKTSGGGGSLPPLPSAPR